MEKKLSEEQIDEIVISQVDNDSEWEEPVHVHKTKPNGDNAVSSFPLVDGDKKRTDKGHMKSTS